jgi:hypothetical protein
MARIRGRPTGDVSTVVPMFLAFYLPLVTGGAMVSGARLAAGLDPMMELEQVLASL